LGLLEAVDTVADRRCPCAEFAAEPDRHGVLQMRPARFQNMVEFDALLIERFLQPAKRFTQLSNLAYRAEANGGRNDVVSALAAIHVVVWMNESLVAALSAQYLVRAVGEHLVHVHIVRSAGPCLEDVYYELVRVLSGQRLIGSCDNGVRRPWF